MTTIIAGGGASALACAIRIKQNDSSHEVILFEHMDRVGKKLLATGNGRCNFSNTHSEYNPAVLAFFNALGLIEHADDEGRLYPYSNQASTILDLLEHSCEQLGVEIITDCAVTSVDRDLCVTTDNGIYMADNVVIATGGKAQKALGSDGSGYRLLKSVGHTITPLSPALVQLTSSSKYPRQLKGMRTRCNLKIAFDDETYCEEYGEVLFTDYGLSGIVTMNLSDAVGKNFADKNPKKCIASLDLIPDMEYTSLIDYINTFGNLEGILGRRLAGILDKQADGDKEKIVRYAKNWKLIITGTKGFDFAQITSGGARLDEFEQFKSKKVNGLYACGEVLDRQFKCGGYNLSFAFYSGIKVADKITKTAAGQKTKDKL